MSMNDTELLAALKDLGLTAEDFQAVLLLPMVQVAWADNVLQKPEREMIMETASTMGLGERGEQAVQRWLDEDPGTTYTLRGHAVLRELARRQRVSLKDMDSMVSLAEGVARAAGGLFGVAFTVDTREKETLQRIESNLSAASIDFAGGSWDAVLDELN